jgi:hypothetical protein
MRICLNALLANKQLITWWKRWAKALWMVDVSEPHVTLKNANSTGVDKTKAADYSPLVVQLEDKSWGVLMKAPYEDPQGVET